MFFWFLSENLRLNDLKRVHVFSDFACGFDQNFYFGCALFLHLLHDLGFPIYCNVREQLKTAVLLATHVVHPPPKLMVMKTMI